MTIQEFIEKARANQANPAPSPTMRLFCLLVRAQYRAGRMTEEKIRAMVPNYLTTDEVDLILAE